MICEKHHRDLLKLSGALVCPACLAEHSVGASSMVSSMKAKLMASEYRRRLSEAQIPSGFLDCGFDNFVAASPRAERVRDVLSTYCANFEAQRGVRPGFIFIGNPGTGKTHIACAMVSALVDAGYRSIYTSMPRLTSEVRASYGRPGAMEELKGRLVSCDFLVLDEIDLHGTSDSDYALLYEIVNSRYERVGHPTLAISNRGIDHLKRDLDERMTSRILAGSSPIVFDWPSRREVRLSQRRLPTREAS